MIIGSEACGDELLYTSIKMAEMIATYAFLVSNPPSEELPPWARDARIGKRKGGPPLRPKQKDSPYFGVPESEWAAITRQLIAKHPLPGTLLVDTVLKSWSAIFESRLGSGFKIGVDIKPVPQIMGFFLHAQYHSNLRKLFPVGVQTPSLQNEILSFISDNEFSMEIKTSSHPSQVFGNRSYGIDNPGKGKKAKDSYYLTVNFEKWTPSNDVKPKILLIRFGWLDHTDWVSQRTETGQQSNLPSVVDNNQLLILFDDALNWRV